MNKEIRELVDAAIDVLDAVKQGLKPHPYVEIVRLEKAIDAFDVTEEDAGRELSEDERMMEHYHKVNQSNANLQERGEVKPVEPTMETPTLEGIMAWEAQGGCYSITGDWVEPDGHGPDGAPSWMIYLGYI